MKQYLFSLILIISITTVYASEEKTSDTIDIVDLDIDNEFINQLYNLKIANDTNPQSDTFICDDTTLDALAYIDTQAKPKQSQVKEAFFPILAQSKECQSSFNVEALKSEPAAIDNDTILHMLSHIEKQKNRSKSGATKKYNKLKKPNKQTRNISDNPNTK